MDNQGIWNGGVTMLKIKVIYTDEVEYNSFIKQLAPMKVRREGGVYTSPNTDKKRVHLWIEKEGKDYGKA